ncbi:hypothetical protein BDR06DRAFT_973263 [Suillus hirtellus]|nr:hypothetical protein BDR06DRAFT_973263 [Suillus hirtellus]
MSQVVPNRVRYYSTFRGELRIFSMGIVFLHLAHREPEIKYYAFYAGAHAIVMGALGLLASRSIYRNALAKKIMNEATKSQSSAETAHETTGTQGIWEDANPRGVSENVDLHQCTGAAELQIQDATKTHIRRFIGIPMVQFHACTEHQLR